MSLPFPIYVAFGVDGWDGVCYTKKVSKIRIS